MTLNLWTLVFCVLMYGPVTEACLSVCSCYRIPSCNGTFVNCHNKGLIKVPTNIPTDTCNIDLGSNQITTLGDNAFYGLSNLTRLGLRDNEITNIQTNAFNGLPNLQDLDLQQNRINTLGDNAFDSLSNLDTLWLNFNKITTIQTNTFNGLPNLQKLYLNGNIITTIPHNAFASLHNLNLLLLDSNKISIIQSNAFHGLTNLQELYIDNNTITILDKDIFLGLSKLEILDLNNNPLHCGCILADFVRFSQSRNLTLGFLSEPKCSTPSKLKGVLLQDLSSEDMNCDVTTATAPVKETTGKMVILLK
ncbi:carboxypeptidase N subunit 2-like [Saccostrea cucullata]|uniref:carboxypeptidase N subunit 2-like n=1 Tax=Saccostrea cuccullata TaxID=36930 RepID=UPI002ED626E6